MASLLDKAKTSVSSVSRTNGNPDEERAYYVGRWAVQGTQAGCLAATPLYFLNSVRGGGFSLRGLARYNWLGPLAGGLVGGAAGLVQASQSDGASITSKSLSLRADADRVRRDDIHLIGGVLGALIVPAIFLKRVGLINGALGGIGLGGAAGLITHTFQKYGGAQGVAQRGQELVQEGEQKASELARQGEQKAGQLQREAERKLS
ncbi:unnamed protein product [Tilletia controversa]|uniref:Uncharacterized protein n=3 Tax=Tilletia TaxID=13289 RepID=A0A8X7SZ30_9BASI|nr:hypothetical protein CF336_g1157 [Tilletia laevis]KAE8204150.1 hypothetical protein CF328_g1246 [Tilletia controversa]KAE8264399.1 hypothetical protein A4X03_0g977 [Tilletia caries]KAE8207963.1 hypothetical protein CF335_g763 [Tilletia laevis]KAE8253083.1 hypothetical protein A4X06_0g1711 [Tilletia controversa]